MIRGKKHFLPLSPLVYGFGLLFRLDESCLEKHKDERKTKYLDSSFDGEEDTSTEEHNSADCLDGESEAEPTLMIRKQQDIESFIDPKLLEAEEEIINVHRSRTDKSRQMNDVSYLVFFVLLIY